MLLRSAVLLAACLFFLSCGSQKSSSSISSAPKDVGFAPKASALFTKILLENKTNLPELSIRNYKEGAPITSSECRASVIVPARGEDPVFSSKNQIMCRFMQDLNIGTILLSLKETPVLRHGSFINDRSFEIEGNLAARLSVFFETAYNKDPSNRLIKSIKQDFPQTQDTLTWVELLSEEDPGYLSPPDPDRTAIATISCDKFYYQGRLWKQFCSFMHSAD
jgi:hypothetical protein